MAPTRRSVLASMGSGFGFGMGGDDHDCDCKCHTCELRDFTGDEARDAKQVLVKLIIAECGDLFEDIEVHVFIEADGDYYVLVDIDVESPSEGRDDAILTALTDAYHDFAHENPIFVRMLVAQQTNGRLYASFTVKREWITYSRERMYQEVRWTRDYS